MVAAKKKTKPGLYANIQSKQERIAHGSGEKMRKPGSPGAPSQEAFDAAAGKKAGKSAKKGPAKKKTSAKATSRR